MVKGGDIKDAKIPCASTVGSLMYATVCTRPDITHVVGIMNKFLSNS